MLAFAVIAIGLALVALGVWIWDALLIKQGRSRRAVALQSAQAALTAAGKAGAISRENVRVAAKFARGDKLTFPEREVMVRTAASADIPGFSEGALRRQWDAEDGLESAKERVAVAEANSRERIATFEQQFVESMEGKIDKCVMIQLSDGEQAGDSLIPACAAQDDVFVWPFPRHTIAARKLELTLGESGGTVAIIKNEQAAQIAAEIAPGRRAWHGTVIFFNERTLEQPAHAGIMLFRVTPEYWGKLTADPLFQEGNEKRSLRR